MPKPFLVERAREIAILVTVAGAVLSVLSIIDLTIHNIGLGDWAYWTIVIGLLLFIIGIWLLASYLKLTSQFDHYMKIASRAEFKREEDELEYIAWRLPSRFEKRLAQKKEELGVK
jgi:hypothetical protein